MSSPKPLAEAALQEPPVQEVALKPPPRAPWLADCDAFKNPPPSHRRIRNKNVIPLYMLAWTCPREEYYANVSDDRWQADSALERLIVWKRLYAACGGKKSLDFLFRLDIDYDYSGNVYLGVMFNFRFEDYSDKLKDLWMDEDFLYIRDAFGIPKNTALDETLAWYQYPVRMGKDFKAVRWQAT